MYSRSPILLLFLLAACARPQATVLQGQAMGTTWSVTLAVPLDEAGRMAAEAAIDGVLAEVDATLSTWNPHSEISALQRSSDTGWQPVSEPLYAVLKAARAVNLQSGGAFDITVAPLVEAWGFGQGAVDRGPPSTSALAAALGNVGAGRLELRAQPRSIRKLSPTLRLDLDGIAPGYAVDRISVALVALGFKDHIVELGGEVHCSGRGPQGRPWRIAVEKPLSGERAVQTIVALEDLGISTSGDYRDFRVLDERRISHTIDPHTGAPVTHALASVSVVNSSTMLADAYATALMVLGPEEGYDLSERLALPALFVVRQGGDLVERANPSFAALQAGAATVPAAAHN